MMTTNATDGAALVALARAALDAAVRRHAAPDPPPTPLFQRRAGAFVTLRKQHELRGCIGQPEPHDPLGSVIVHCAAAAALEDPRFPPVEAAELPSIAVEDLGAHAAREGVAIRRPSKSGVTDWSSRAAGVAVCCFRRCRRSGAGRARSFWSRPAARRACPGTRGATAPTCSRSRPRSSTRRR